MEIYKSTKSTNSKNSADERLQTRLEKAHTFENHSPKVLNAFNSQNPAHDDEAIELLESPDQLHLPITPFTQTQVRGIISELNIKKSPVMT